MNKKNIIQIIIIFACFAASGIVIYNNFIKKPSLPLELSQGSNAPQAAQVEAPILPNGEVFDLAEIRNSKFRFNLLDYPKLNYASEVGTNEQDFLKPLQTLPETDNQNKK